MNSDSFRRSENLVELAQRLRLNKPNPNFEIEDSGAELFPRFETRPTRAAVLICLFEDENGDLRVILTKRSSTMSSHSGEVALPGGKRDDGDENDAETALREAKEEIGLEASAVERNITVFPVIGIIWDKSAFNPVLNAAEVESIFDAPLLMFLKDENRRQEEREFMGCKYLLHFFDHKARNESYVIWALTAGILIKAASVVYQLPPAFETRMPPFWNRK
ncbi:PREDICTED: nudix hydrolase 15, mitochondrial isoform X2 [Erythranthe guttata]|uniref:nudix hydrolase 15, mitochondrial isoform X2 n=1 Tax=Erythranthe guttata TaxID=4155 RepID=UPI00064DBB1B|nr:PREDICTED: nudix hydrolase 15, mitochondrial isoform X2 [Erythranthe guttata]|eukprot:XP_012830325.1 PREDICTED: nudix hydrolase 15, mitochondrial isoform X2 [Erythranthe guttata]